MYVLTTTKYQVIWSRQKLLKYFVIVIKALVFMPSQIARTTRSDSRAALRNLVAILLYYCINMLLKSKGLRSCAFRNQDLKRRLCSDQRKFPFKKDEIETDFRY